VARQVHKLLAQAVPVVLDAGTQRKWELFLGQVEEMLGGIGHGASAGGGIAVIIPKAPADYRALAPALDRRNEAGAG
jgi:hypothetical protein